MGVEMMGCSFKTWGLQTRSARTCHRKVPPARPCGIVQDNSELSPQQQRTWALITLSGQTYASSVSDIWCNIGGVLGRVNANIEDAACTSMRSPVLKSGDAVEAHGSPNTSFLVSAFNEPILVPPSPSFQADEDGANSMAVAIIVRASLVESSVPVMTKLLHTQFPHLVCTVTIGGATEEAEASTLAQQQQNEQQQEQQRPRLLTGTIRLFGVDRAGQLTGVAEVLRRCRVTILNLLVTTGFCDVETGEFIERAGGPLGENVISIAAFDRAAFDEAALRQEVEVAARDVGYEVTSIILDSQEARSQELAGYYLRRKAFIADLGQVEPPLLQLTGDAPDTGSAGERRGTGHGSQGGPK
uniref:ACT domain-containing protein n=1 Tax=Pyrodinium bahamense TaxID=73915 RepID=A0A7S0BAZ1_9DINO